MFSLEKSGNGGFVRPVGAIFPLREAAGTGAFARAGAVAVPNTFPLVGAATDVFTPETEAFPTTGAAAIIAGTGADFAVSSALKNSWPVTKRSNGFFDNAFASTLEIPSETLGWAFDAGNGSTSVRLRSISPVCFPANGLRVV